MKTDVASSQNSNGLNKVWRRVVVMALLRRFAIPGFFMEKRIESLSGND